jgi:hypothetical protein
MKNKFLISLAPALVAAALAVVPSTALAVVSKACTTNVLCSGNSGAEPLRDDATTPPTGGGYGTSVLAVNTAGNLRYGFKVAGVTARNEIEAGYADFGIKLVENPKSKAGECVVAKGLVTWVDIQKAGLSGNKKSSPVYDNTEKAWPLSVRSDFCATEPGVVKVEGVGLFLPELEKEVVGGALTGKYVQPTGGEVAPCPAGGVEFNVKQPLVTLSVGEAGSFELDNGTVGKPAFLCFVAANNYLFPKTAPKWAPFSDFTESEKPGLWKD